MNFPETQRQRRCCRRPVFKCVARLSEVSQQNHHVCRRSASTNGAMVTRECQPNDYECKKSQRTEPTKPTVSAPEPIKPTMSPPELTKSNVSPSTRPSQTAPAEAPPSLPHYAQRLTRSTPEWSQICRFHDSHTSTPTMHLHHAPTSHTHQRNNTAPNATRLMRAGLGGGAHKGRILYLEDLCRTVHRPSLLPPCTGWCERSALSLGGCGAPDRWGAVGHVPLKTQLST